MEEGKEISKNPSPNNLHRKQKKNKHKKYRHFNYVEPITSFGIILSTIKDGKLLYLLYQRRDNVEYVEFMRGSWTNEGQLPALFSLMSHEERERIRSYTFSELWDDLWIEHNSRIYRDGMSKAMKKYDSIKHKIVELLDTTTSHISSPPWGFPKGKKNYPTEDPIKCALRELKEETRIPTENIKPLWTSPLPENFKGTNGKAYATYYYVAFIPYTPLPSLIETPDCIRKHTISEEAGCIGWFSLKDCMGNLHPRRQKMLSSVHNKLSTHFQQ